MRHILIRLFLFLTFGFYFQGNSAYAGFEWVPAKQPPISADPTAPIFSDITEQASSQAPLAPEPLALEPSETKVFMEPVSQEPLPVIEPLIEPAKQAVSPPPPMPEQVLPKPIISEPKKQSRNIVPSVASNPPPPPPLEPDLISNEKVINDKPPEPVLKNPGLEQIKKAENSITTSKVIMPQDAPQNAFDSTPGSERININMFPNVNPPEQIQKAQVVPSAQSASDIPKAQDVVVGFGTDVTLAIALQQIVPAGHAFSFEPGVNPGVKVSWNGGKAWIDVIKEMILPLGLDISVREKVVHIKSLKAEPAPPVPLSSAAK